MNKTNQLPSSKAFSEVISYSLRFSLSSLFSGKRVGTGQLKFGNDRVITAIAPIMGKEKRNKVIK